MEKARGRPFISCTSLMKGHCIILELQEDGVSKNKSVYLKTVGCSGLDLANSYIWTLLESMWTILGPAFFRERTLLHQCLQVKATGNSVAVKDTEP